MKLPPLLKTPMGVAASSAYATLLLVSPALADGDDYCPTLYKRGVISLDFNPAFVEVDEYNAASCGPRDGLTISSFFNAEVVPGGTPPVRFFERDLVARIPDIGALDIDGFNPATDLQVLTDLAPGMPKTVWPNEAERAPDGVFPFEAVVIPQGFISAGFPGRLTAVDVATGTEYVIHQSTQLPTGPTAPLDPANSPRAYHRAIYMDIDADGLDDIVTVRSGFRVGRQVYPPFGELVWFKNPGLALAPNVPWQETILFGGPAAGFLGPDIALAAHDFEGDGVPEIVATHFFSGAPPGPPGSPPPSNGKISIYGTAPGGTWAQVNALAFRPRPRIKDISNDQGFPFDIEIVDLNRDGRADILATNHQPDGCSFMTASVVPGRVYALEAPASGDLFAGDWTTHVLLDDIRPQPSLQPIRPPGRLAPGRAKTFAPRRGDATHPHKKPWIVVGGDQAGKVWVLEPDACQDWEYKSAVIFDINDYYGPGTTQTPMLDPFGIAISTIGSVGVRYDRPGSGGRAQFYIPVFEGKDIHVLSFRRERGQPRLECPAGETLQCPPPAPPPGGGPPSAP